MSAIFAVTLPVFLVIGAGYLAVWRGLFAADQVDALMLFTQKFAIPCLLFQAMATLDLTQSFDWRLLASYYAGSIVMFLSGTLGARALFGRAWEDAVAIGFTAMFANTVLLGLPITERAYGPQSLAPTYTIVAFHATFCYFLGITAMEIAKARAATDRMRVGALAFGGHLLRTTFGNALIIGAGLGLAVNFAGITVPGALAEAIRLMTQAALPAALFGLGGILVRYRPEGDLRTIAFVCALSLILHPSVSYAVGANLALDQEALRAAVLTGAMAPGVNGYLFAAMYGRAMRVAASSVLLGTVVSIFTVSVWLLILG